MKTTTRNCDCDHCHKPFTITLQTTRIAGGGEHWSFTCPHCNHSYTVATITHQGVELRHQLESLKAQLRLAPHRTDLAQQREQLQAKFLKEVTSLIPPGHNNDGGLTNAILATPTIEADQ